MVFASETAPFTQIVKVRIIRVLVIVDSNHECKKALELLAKDGSYTSVEGCEVIHILVLNFILQQRRAGMLGCCSQLKL